MAKFLAISSILPEARIAWRGVRRQEETGRETTE
jgi:hypothetical protein